MAGKISPDKARELQKLSMTSRIARHFVAMFQGKKPSRKRETDAGFDIKILGAHTLTHGEFYLLPTDTFVRCPKGYYFQIMARSNSIINGMIVPTAVIDAEYTGEIKVGVWNMSGRTITLEDGDRIAQILFFPIIHATFEKVDVFPPSERGVAGFGSSGK